MLFLSNKSVDTGGIQFGRFNFKSCIYIYVPFSDAKLYVNCQFLCLQLVIQAIFIQPLPLGHTMLIVACKCLNIKASISVSEADRSICTPLESMPDYECIGPFRNPADLLIEIKHDELTRSCRAQATAPRTPWTLITCMICNQIVCGSRRAVTEASSGEAVHGESVPFEVVLNRKLLVGVTETRCLSPSNSSPPYRPQLKLSAR